MIQVFADGEMVFDSRLDSKRILALTYTTGLNKSGTATLMLPPAHQSYNGFISYRTQVQIYKDKKMVFNGRALTHDDDFFNRRTITCEGERGYFRDAVMRPYQYEQDPATIFKSIIEIYNAQVDEFKRFKVGKVTVTDPNSYIRLESTKAEQVSEVIDKLVERCGGYVVFTTDDLGARVVNWYATLNNRSNQTIEFGLNLTDFARSDANDDLATVIVPYGAQIEEEKSKDAEEKEEFFEKRVTIESVNNGIDYIQDKAAVALRGVITRPVYWDDVTEPENLLAKAKAYLASNKNLVTSLKLTAVDLSELDKDIDTMQVGDLIRVKSKPHGVDEDFLLTERSVDLLKPSSSSVTLGKEKISFIGLSVASARKNSNALQQTEKNVRASAKSNVTTAVESVKVDLESLIQKTKEDLKKEASTTYVTESEVQQTVETKVKQLAESYGWPYGPVFGLGEIKEIIQEKANLDSYTKPGMYACQTKAAVATLYNRPTNEPFTMRVYSALGNKDTKGSPWYLLQEVQSYQATEPTYRRTLTRDAAGTWTSGSWVEETVSTISAINER